MEKESKKSTYFPVQEGGNKTEILWMLHEPGSRRAKGMIKKITMKMFGWRNQLLLLSK